MATTVERLARELKASEIKAIQSKQIRVLKNLYRDAWTRIQAELLSGELTMAKARRLNEIQSQVNAILKALSEKTNDKIPGMVDGAYESGVGLSQRAYNRIYGESVAINMGTLLHTQAIDVVAQQMALDLARGNSDTMDLVSRYLMRTKLDNRIDAVISRNIAESLIGGESLRGTTDRVLQTLRTRIGDDQVIRVGRSLYKPEHYARMVAQTRMREATTQGTINTAVELGMSLVMIDTHDEPCEYCQQFNGRVFSLTGNDDGFPVMEQQPPFHPFCQCTAHPTTRGHLEDLGLLEPIQQLSNDPSVAVEDNDKWQSIIEGYRKKMS